MIFSDYFGYAFTHIKNKKARVFLTVLGVALSVMAMVSIISITEGFGEAIQLALNAQFSTDTLVVVDPLGQTVLTLKDVDLLKSRLPSTNYKRVTPVLIFSAEVSRVGKAESVITLVAGASTNEIRYVWPILYVAEEGVLPQGDLNPDEVILGNSLAKRLNVHAGDMIRIRSEVKDLQGKVITTITRDLKVIGILKLSGMNLVGVDVDSSVIMNFDTSRMMVNPPDLRDKISLILVQFNSPKFALELQSEIQDNIYGGKVRAVAFAAYARAVENVVMLFNSLLLSLIIISVVIAGVGVMNTMLTSVRERVKEIGTNRALGAKSSEILTLFLVEAFIIAVLGMILGTILGFISVFVIDKSNLLQSAINLGGVIYIKASPKIVLQNLIIWNLIVLFATLAFSYIPARRASKVEPIIALRYE
jgi:ABC-type transport system, involved in lipoprotein release, permease component